MHHPYAVQDLKGQNNLILVWAGGWTCFLYSPLRLYNSFVIFHLSFAYFVQWLAFISLQWRRDGVYVQFLLLNKLLPNYKFTSNQREADNWPPLFVSMFIIWIESRLHCIDLYDDDYKSFVFNSLSDSLSFVWWIVSVALYF